MKKCLCLILIMAIFATFGCAKTDNVQYSNAHYEVIKENGKCYIYVKDPQLYTAGTDDANTCMGYNVPEFSSLDELKEAIITGSLSEKYIRSLRSEQQRYAAAGKSMEVWDMNKLYHATLPEQIDVSLEYIQWGWSTYNFNYKGKPNINFQLLNEESYNFAFNSFGDRDFVSKNTNFVETQIEDRNATQWTYIAPRNVNIKVLRYTLEGEDKTLHIAELYSPNDDPPVFYDEYVDEEPDVLNYIQILGVHHGVYFDVYVSDIAERPSEEWLLSLGVREYEGNGQ